MALKLKGSTSGFVGLDAPSVAGNNTLILPENSGSAFQVFANDITAGVTTFTQVTVSRNGDLTVPGTISIGGTLTYEDVTSVDSIGIVTARGLSIFGNTSGLNVTGVGTFVNGSISLTSGGAERLNIASPGGGHVLIKNPSAAYLAFGTNDTERLRITSAGNVGINTDNPTAPLAVMSSSDPEIRFGYNETQDHKITWDSSKVFLEADPDNANSNSALGFKVDGSERMRITSTGLIGIGTDNPLSGAAGARVNIYFKDETTYNSTTNRANGLIINNTASGGYSSLELGQRTTSGNTYGSAIINAVDPADGNQYGADLTFQTRATGSGNYGERMRITSGGTLLVNGTDASVVHTNADDVVIGNTSASVAGLSIATGTSGYATLQFSDGGGNKNQGQIAYNHADDTMMLTTAENVRLKILSDGTVNIGNKAYVAQNSTVDSLRIGYGLNLYEDSYSSGNDNYTVLANNVYYAASAGGNKYIRSDEASRFMQQAGVFTFQNAAAGTAGNAVSLTSRLTIQADGSMYANSSSGSLANLTLKKAANDGIDYLQCRGTANGLNMKVGGNGGISNVQANDANLSDQTMKKNIVDCESIIEKFKQWKVRKFNYKSESDGTPLNYGLIAQEIETIHSDLVNADFPVEDEEGNEVMKKTVKDHQLMMMSFKALQEAIAKIETLEAEVSALKGS
tara:strand:- start:547 stop:2595 length:2049 start_codon:yes stop_codon:yes gene_type:complete